MSLRVSLETHKLSVNTFPVRLKSRIEFIGIIAKENLEKKNKKSIISVVVALNFNSLKMWDLT